MKNHDDIFAKRSKISHLVHEVYDTGYDKGYADRGIEEEFDEDRKKAIEDAYQKGLDDAWECAVKIVNSPLSDAKILEELFNTTLPEDVLPTTSASEAIAKIKEYEEKQKADDEIKVGDEVMVDERRMIVLGIDLAGWRHLWCPSTGFVHSNITTSEMTKTGRHFDIQSILDQMNDEQ